MGFVNDVASTMGTGSMTVLAELEEVKYRAAQTPPVDHSGDAVLRFMDIELDWRAHRVRRGQRSIHLSTLDLRILRFLMLAPTRVFTRDEILQGVWPRGVFVTERTVDVHMAALRKALSDADGTTPVRTVRGRGYSIDSADMS